MIFHRSLLAAALATIVLQGCSMSLFGSDRPAPAPAATVAEPAPVPAEAVADAQPVDEFDLASFDSNHDGQLTKDELEAGLKALYAKLDVSGDGFLSSSEVRAINDKLLAVQGGSPIIDWNADGRIEMPEFASQWRTRFERADINRDMVLDDRELAGKVRQREPHELPQPELGKYRGRTG